MYTVTKYVHNDGEEYGSLYDAKRALDQKYGNALCGLARELCNTNGKYSAVLEYLENNMEKVQDVVGLYNELHDGLHTHSEED